MSLPPGMMPSDEAACEQAIARHSRSFYLSSRLLPRDVRVASWALYAFCRRSDDAVDEAPEQEQREQRLEGLRERLDRVYEGGVPDPRRAGLDPIERSFAAVAARHSIERALPDELLAGMAMDVTPMHYRTLDELYLYAFRVASVVGLMMTQVMGESRPDALVRAAELGLAMQLTNIARDVGDDARRGRVYLPDELLSPLGLTAADVLAAREATPPLREATRRLLTLASSLYASSERGIPLLPPACRPAIAAASRIYAAIGDELARSGHDSVTMRAHTSTAQKLSLALSALPLCVRPSTHERGQLDGFLIAQIARCGLRC